MTSKDQTSMFSLLRPSQRIDFPAKVNVHIVLRGALFRRCVELNAGIAAITRNEIDFSPTSLQIPHLTLDVGFIKDLRKYHMMLERVNSLASATSCFDLKLSPPYIHSRNTNWIFLDALPESGLTALRERARHHFRDLLDPLSWNISESPVHATVGYIEARISALTRYLQLNSEIVSGRAEIVGISFAGKRGSCLGHIKIYDLVNS